MINVVEELKSGGITAEEALKKLELWKYRAATYELKEILKQEKYIKEFQKNRLRL